MKTRYLMLVLSLLFLSALLTKKSDAQDTAYVITAKKDTIKCLLRMSLSKNKGKYRLDRKSAFVDMTPDNTREYYFVDDTVSYASIQMPGNSERKFLKILEKGQINLYEEVITRASMSMGMSMTNSTTTWYAGQTADDVKEVKTSGIGGNGVNRGDRKKALTDLLQDKPKVLQRFIKSDEFSFDNIQDAIQRYNALPPVKAN